MVEAPAATARLQLEPRRDVLCAGEELRGMAVLTLDAPRLVRSLTVVAAGREIIHATPHYAPAVYRFPVPRPFGRTRSGSVHVDYEVRAHTLARPGTWPAGRHVCPFRISLPADALPSYGGASVVVEHELLATADIAGAAPLHCWAPLHVWRPAEDVAASGEPIELRAEGRWSLTLRLASDAAFLGETLRAAYVIDNPHGLRPMHLRLSLVGVETSRHLAATDVHAYVAAQRTVVLEPSARMAGVIDWSLPTALAPTMAGHRFKLDWRLEATVSGPWQRGVTASAPLRLFDRLRGGETDPT